MSNLNEMWVALTKFQPYADKLGFGAEWRTMCTERTIESAENVEKATRGMIEVWSAANAAKGAILNSTCHWPAAKEWADLAIWEIQNAIEEGLKT